jgi:multimeric flavodoxin WrbA
MTVNVLGISGSPRRHGNTETLLDSFLEGAKAAGASVEKVVLKEIDYSPCRGCNACHKTGDCIVKDDAPDLYDKILAADCVAVASPIYSMGITAQLKGFIDRAQYLWARKFILKTLEFSEDHIKRHKGVFISTAGQNLSNVFDGAFPAITALFHGTGYDYSLNIVANNMDTYNGIKNHPTALKKAYEQGKQVVSDLEKVIANIEKTGVPEEKKYQRI